MMTPHYRKKELLSNSTQKGRILIVDDDPVVLRILAASIGELGNRYTVETARNGQEALEKIRQKEYALLITDYIMPNMNGIEVAQLVREVSPKTQIVLMTAYKTENLQTSVNGLELKDMLSKPISFARIQQLIQQVFEQATANSTNSMLLKPSLDRQAQSSRLNEELHALKMDTNARCILLLSSSGHVVELEGYADDLDVSSVSALVAANFMAASELAKLLGNDSIFKSSYYEGLDYDIYSYGITESFLLAVIVGPESKAGLVRFYVNKALKTLPPLLTDDLFVADFGDSDISASIESELDQLFKP